VGLAMKQVFRTLGVLEETPFQSHMFRRGTASTLELLGLKTFLLNQHLGWATSSNMINTYRRSVHLEDFDKKFYEGVFTY
jgi:hypothetical protein